jgi:hypothetical protein
MKYSRFILILFLILFLICCSQSSSLLGQWKSINDKDIDTIEFIEDGTVLLARKNTIMPTTQSLKYKLLSNNRMVWDTGDWRGAVTMKYTISGNTLVIMDESNPREKTTFRKNDLKNYGDERASDFKKVNNESGSKSHESFVGEEHNIGYAVANFLQNNPSYRRATSEYNLDKDCLQIDMFPYSFVGNLTGGGNKDFVVCFIDTKVTPGEYRGKGFTRLRGQFVIVVFSMVQGKLQPFIIEKEFPLEKGRVYIQENKLYVQPFCESGPIISYEWKNGKFVKNIVDQ